MNGEHIVIKENEVFLVCDGDGNVWAAAADGQGLYYRDTRFLSIYQLQVDEFTPVLLSAAGELNFMTTLQLANAAAVLPDGQPLAARTISIRRNRFLFEGLHERIGFYNYNSFPVRATVRINLGSDFRDMFDVRGYAVRDEHGTIAAPLLCEGEIWLAYHGLDRAERRTLVRFDPAPTRIELLAPDPVSEAPRELEGISGHGDPRLEVPIRPPVASALFAIDLPPREPVSLTVTISPQLLAVGETTSSVAPLACGVAPPVPPLDTAYQAIRASYRDWDAECTAIETDHETLNHLLRQSGDDLRLLMNRLPTGLLPTAGIPWFSVPFGRDSLITAYQTLMLNPRIAYGTLRFLAQHQGRVEDHWRDEEPGKILHEIRLGELANRDEVPFGPYYGSVDATPLFLVVLGELVQWTGDWAFADSLRRNVEAALDWIDHYGDADRDGYVEYRTRSQRGIRNQGWKDSPGAVADRLGRSAEPPVALCEVQGYVYAAKQHAALLFERWGDAARAARLRDQAATLQERLERDFWLADERCYALALDAAKRPLPVVSSNAGHLLWSGIVSPERAALLVERLTSDDMLCGWGIRTLSALEPTFNPMSYHNGSVWPHDNALIVAGLRRYGFAEEAGTVATQVCEAGLRFPHYRLPELYCGFTRDRHYHSLPADYPVSCRPQAWAAGSPFLLLQHTLGIAADLPNRRVLIRPRMLPGVAEVRLGRLSVLGSRLDLTIRLANGRTHVEVGNAQAPAIVVEGDTVAVALPTEPA